jgi:amidophosphoribosyltransferase
MPTAPMIEGKRVILVDDSIVRGTTSMKIVEMVRDAGAKEVHMRIASPPTTDPCFYGIDTPDKDKLLASRYDVAGMAKFIGVDSLAFVSIDGLYRAMGLPGRNSAEPAFCDACFTTEYPTRLTDFEGSDNVRTLSLLAGGA